MSLQPTALQYKAARSSNTNITSGLPSLLFANYRWMSLLGRWYAYNGTFKPPPTLFHGFPDQSGKMHGMVWSAPTFMLRYAICDWQIIKPHTVKWGHTKGKPLLVRHCHCPTSPARQFVFVSVWTMKLMYCKSGANMQTSSKTITLWPATNGRGRSRVWTS